MTDSITLALPERPAPDYYLMLHGMKGLLIMVLMLLPLRVLADFSIQTAKTRLLENVYLLDAQINYLLTNDPQEALQSSITLTFVLDINVHRERWLLWDEVILSLRQRYTLRYYPLSRRYILKNLNAGSQESFPTVNSALSSLGRIKSLPLVDRYLIKDGETYRVHLQTYLDIEALPAALRPIAYFSSQWRLASETYICPLTPHDSG